MGNNCNGYTRLPKDFSSKQVLQSLHFLFEFFHGHTIFQNSAPIQKMKKSSRFLVSSSVGLIPHHSQPDSTSVCLQLPIQCLLTDKNKI